MATVICGADNFDTAVKQGLGEGQTWQDVRASRLAYTTYTNTTGRSIQVHVACSMNGGRLTMTVGGVLLEADDISAAGEGSNFDAIVPNNTTYRIDGGISTIATIDSWVELR